MASAAAIAGIVAGLGSVAGGAIQAKQSLDEADVQKRVGRADEEEIRRRGRRLEGMQRVAQAASGVVVDEGTPLDVLAQTAEETELERLRRRFASDRAVRQKKVQAISQLVAGIGGGASSIFGSGRSTLLGKGKI